MQNKSREVEEKKFIYFLIHVVVSSFVIHPTYIFQRKLIKTKTQTIRDGIRFYAVENSFHLSSILFLRKNEY